MNFSKSPYPALTLIGVAWVVFTLYAFDMIPF